MSRRAHLGYAAKPQVIEHLSQHDLSAEQVEEIADAFLKAFHVQRNANRPKRPVYIMEGQVWRRRPEKRQRIKDIPPVRLTLVKFGDDGQRIYWERVEHVDDLPDRGSCARTTFLTDYDYHPEDNDG